MSENVEHPHRRTPATNAHQGYKELKTSDHVCLLYHILKTMSTKGFSSVPILDYTLLSSPATRPTFISQLRHALINVGFLYLSHTPIPPAEFTAVSDYAPRLFSIPQEEKEKIEMVNSSCFYGYSRVGAELTKGRRDWREQFDFGTEWEGENERRNGPEYLKLWGPSQWPPESTIPGLKETLLNYFSKVEKLSIEFIGLIEEAFELPNGALDVFFSDPPSTESTTNGANCTNGITNRNPNGTGGRKFKVQHRTKVIKYPALEDEDDDQGVGPHFDGGFLTFLLQASPHKRGLQVQNLAGEWIDVPPIPGTFVINIGKALETVTQGLARATSHRVLSPVKGDSPRYSVPFFQSIAQGVKVNEYVLPFSPEVLKLKETRGELGATDSVNYTEYGLYPSGHVALIGRVKSHPDVGQRHYPDMFKKFFPDGLPSHGSAY